VLALKKKTFFGARPRFSAASCFFFFRPRVSSLLFLSFFCGPVSNLLAVPATRDELRTVRFFF
jgi:hypothetical protein